MRKKFKTLIIKLIVRFISEDDVEWVVNDMSELGVKIGSRFFFLYKGDSLEYKEFENAKHEDGTMMKYRQVGKREFGECCYPLHLKVLPERYIEGEDWKEL